MNSINSDSPGWENYNFYLGSLTNFQTLQWKSPHLFNFMIFAAMHKKIRCHFRWDLQRESSCCEYKLDHHHIWEILQVVNPCAQSLIVKMRGFHNSMLGWSRFDCEIQHNSLKKDKQHTAKRTQYMFHSSYINRRLHLSAQRQPSRH